ncbi:MAG: DUF2783 domain-containing protein [Reyranellaceae bacterium]
MVETPKTLRSDPAIADPDGFYNALVDCYRDLDEAQVGLFNARLILLLANQVGDSAVLEQALRAAREGL